MGRIIDCFIFYNELDILTIRLEELYDVVDKFVIVEANSTFSGKHKEWNFEKSSKRFEKYVDKIIYIKVEDMPNTGDAWQNEFHQRNAINRSYSQLEETDILIIGDVDEIPSSKGLQFIKENTQLLPVRLEMDFYNYNFNCRVYPDWLSGSIAYWLKDAVHSLPQDLRKRSVNRVTCRGLGWHLSWFGDADFCVNKIRNFAHQELNTEPIISKLESRKSRYEDYFPESGRNWTFKHEFLDTYLPKCVLENRFDFVKKYVDQPINISFVTYADSCFETAGKRIINEAWSCGIFSSVKCYRRQDLDQDFVTKNAYLLSHKRGGGYWCWKPHIILKELERVRENDWVLYTDAGCTLLPERRDSFINIITEMEKTGKEMLAYALTHCEKTWTKGDIFKFMCIKDTDMDYNSNQLISGIIPFKNTQFSRSVISKWMKIIEDYPNLVDDSLSTTPNDPSFVENRHDQSILSLLMKSNKEKVRIIADDSYMGSGFIQATRLK